MVTYRSERPVQPAAAPGPGPRLTGDDALRFLLTVRDTFAGEHRHKYEEFLDIMSDFKTGRLSTEGVVERVKVLFDGHPRLVLGFSVFLPRGYEIMVDQAPGLKRTAAAAAAEEEEEEEEEENY